jgi:hypothetical protein
MVSTVYLEDFARCGHHNTMPMSDPLPKEPDSKEGMWELCSVRETRRSFKLKSGPAICKFCSIEGLKF